MAEKLLTIADVADRLNVERHKASDLMKLMPCFIFPGTRNKRVREADFDEWMKANTVVQAMEKSRRKKPLGPTTPACLDLELFEPDGRIKRRRT